MVNEIAVCVDNFGEVTEYKKAKSIKVFEKQGTEWRVIRELAFKFYCIKDSEESCLEVLNIVQDLGKCKVFVAKKFSDLVHATLDKMGLSLWKMDGNPIYFLEYILEQEKEEKKVSKFIKHSDISDNGQFIISLGNGECGRYILNLKNLQKDNIGITSKQALRPVLNKRIFNELIIVCSHIPNWLEEDLTKLNLNFQFSKIGENDYVVVINNYDEY